MGMFDKDKELGRQMVGAFNYGDEFIVWDAAVDDEKVPTKLGAATKTRLYVSRLDKPLDKFEVNTLASAIAEKAAEAESGDFPAVVQLIQVRGQGDSQATVLQFVKPWTGQGSASATTTTQETHTAPPQVGGTGGTFGDPQ